ncbi:hypothetical protein [Moritella sp.]|uniref:hypothetical protein n=1 Tax=Moritella sp. TaxID=78556 RepID=UPI001D93C963|nr:hypothetical protein [Moritella sp.]MCJ8350536.1 hypothetical protein [Moritella sp.]NQZ41785.1 hypothetical protein [Moritella sp.]
MLEVVNNSPYSKKAYSEKIIEWLFKEKRISGPTKIHGSKLFSGVRAQLNCNYHYLFIASNGDYLFFHKDRIKEVFSDDIYWQINHKETGYEYSSAL